MILIKTVFEDGSEESVSFDRLGVVVGSIYNTLEHELYPNALTKPAKRGKLIKIEIDPHHEP